eukprot:215144-Chlamydomonas_euryale.AAC.2
MAAWLDEHSDQQRADLLTVYYKRLCRRSSSIARPRRTHAAGAAHRRAVAAEGHVAIPVAISAKGRSPAGSAAEAAPSGKISTIADVTRAVPPARWPSTVAEFGHDCV